MIHIQKQIMIRILNSRKIKYGSRYEYDSENKLKRDDIWSRLCFITMVVVCKADRIR